MDASIIIEAMSVLYLVCDTASLSFGVKGASLMIKVMVISIIKKLGL